MCNVDRNKFGPIGCRLDQIEAQLRLLEYEHREATMYGDSIALQSINYTRETLHTERRFLRQELLKLFNATM